MGGKDNSEGKSKAVEGAKQELGNGLADLTLDMPNVQG